MTDKPIAKLCEQLKLLDNWVDVTHKYVGKIFIMRFAQVNISGDCGDITIIDASAKPRQPATPKPPSQVLSVIENDGAPRKHWPTRPKRFNSAEDQEP